MDSLKFFKFLLMTFVFVLPVLGVGIVFFRDFPLAIMGLIAISSLLMSKFYGDFIKVPSISDKIHQKDIFFLSVFSLISITVFTTFNISTVQVDSAFYSLPATCFCLLFYRTLNAS